MVRRILLCRFSADVNDDAVKGFIHLGRALGMTIESASLDDLEDTSAFELGGDYDAVILLAHGDSKNLVSVGNGHGQRRSINWSELVARIEQRYRIAKNAVLINGCCYGGVGVVVLRILQRSTRFGVVIGPSGAILDRDLLVIIPLLLHQLSQEGSNIARVLKDAGTVIACDWICVDRETYSHHIEALSRGNQLPLLTSDGRVAI